jgi:drug/metabolite transporter (DMT)-like permease
MGVNPGLGIACALLSATCFGLNPPIAAFLNGFGFVPVEAVVVRSMLMLAVAAAMVAVLRRPLRVSRALWGPLAGITLGTAALSLCYLSSVAFIPVGLAVIILYTFPLLVLVLSPLLEGARLSPRRIVLALLAFAGLVIAIGPSFATLDIRGIGLAATAAVSAVVIFFCGRGLAGHVDEAVNAFWVHLLGTPIVVAAALAAGRGWGWFGPEAAGVLQQAAVPALALGITYAAGYLFMVHGLRHAPPSGLTPFYNIEPVVSIAAAAVLVGERLEANQYAGAGLVLTALVLSGVVAGRQPVPEAGR